MENVERQSVTSRVKDNLTYHLIDSTAMLVESTPIFVAYETLIVGMSDEISLNARLIAAGLTFGGMGMVLSKGRDFSKKFFNIADKTKEKIQAFHDVSYLAAFNLVMSPPLYFISGSRDIKEIAAGTALAILVGGINGAPLGYAIDAFRDLTGLQNCERPSYPNVLKKQSSTIKKGLVAILTAGAIGLTAGIYGLTEDKQEIGYQNEQTMEEVVSK